jgi:PEP-CTERM motif
MKKQLPILASLVLVVASSSIASAQLIGASIVQSSTATNNNYGFNTTGVLGESFVDFNPGYTSDGAIISQTGSQLLGDGITLSYSTANQNVQYTSSPDYNTNPYSGYILAGDGGANSFTFTLSGLQAGATYNVVAYDATGDSQTYSFNGSAPQLVLGAEHTDGTTGNGVYNNTFAAGQNYTEGTNIVADSNGDITIIDNGAYSGNGYGDFAVTNGISVQFVAAAATPEPSTWALMAIGLSIVGFFRFNRARFNS